MMAKCSIDIDEMKKAIAEYMLKKYKVEASRVTIWYDESKNHPFTFYSEIEFTVPLKD